MRKGIDIEKPVSPGTFGRNFYGVLVAYPVRGGKRIFILFSPGHLWKRVSKINEKEIYGNEKFSSDDNFVLFVCSAGGRNGCFRAALGRADQKGFDGRENRFGQLGQSV